MHNTKKTSPKARNFLYFIPSTLELRRTFFARESDQNFCKQKFCVWSEKRCDNTFRPNTVIPQAHLCGQKKTAGGVRNLNSDIVNDFCRHVCAEA